MILVPRGMMKKKLCASVRFEGPIRSQVLARTSGASHRHAAARGAHHRCHRRQHLGLRLPRQSPVLLASGQLVLRLSKFKRLFPRVRRHVRRGRPPGPLRLAASFDRPELAAVLIPAQPVTCASLHVPRSLSDLRELGQEMLGLVRVVGVVLDRHVRRNLHGRPSRSAIAAAFA
jgi:hypothetical protein